MTNKIIKYLLCTVAFLCLLSESAPAFAQERRVSRTERRADRNFIRQKFEKAMTQYETAITREPIELNRASIHLKTARLYFMLRNYAQSSVHFEKALTLHAELFSADDLCNYIDALRFCGDNKKAEGICLNYAYKDIYSRYQRFQNTLDALAMRHDIIEDPSFKVNRLSLNSTNAEFWVGSYAGKPFYAMSYSPFNDPWKLFFHRTHYYVMDETDNTASTPGTPPRYYDYFRRIPADLQNGPLSFSPDMKTMVTTVLEYQKIKASVDVVDKNARPFQTKLLYSNVKNDGGRFSRYQPGFTQHPNHSYAHPFLFNNGKSLLFTSDMSGGFGGFDLYVTHYDEFSDKWGTPVNLGPHVNTEGDEIFPVLYQDRLIFASNGLPGFGGYDLFSTFFDKNGVVPRGVIHFPYPVNSVFNDFYMYPMDLHTAYFVSDRDLSTRDDIYFLRTLQELGTEQGKPFYGMTEDAAIAGGQLLLTSMTERVVAETVMLKPQAPKGLLITLYFNFDSSELTEESVSRLQQFVHELGDYQFNELTFDGYADEVGSENYNYALSERRASRVANFLRDRGVASAFTVIGHGRIKLSQKEIEEEISSYPWAEASIDWTRVNRRARRVEIYNK